MSRSRVKRLARWVELVSAAAEAAREIVGLVKDAREELAARRAKNEEAAAEAAEGGDE